jgi:hypothetical protein
VIDTLPSPRRRLAIIVAAALAMRALAIGNPVVHVDEEFYLAVARMMTHGAIPYFDVWDRKPVGLFLLYMTAAWLPGIAATIAYQALAFAAVVAAAWGIAALATRAGWARGATLAAVAYVIWLDPLGGVSGQSPVFYNAPMAAAAWLVATGGVATRRRWRGVGAMALVGLVLQIKYAAVFEGMFFGCWLLADEWRARRSIGVLAGYAAVLVTVALIPTIAAYGYYASIGHAEDFLYANIWSILARHPDPWGEKLGNAATLVLILSPLLAMACAAWGRGEGGEARVRYFVFAWAGVAVAGVVAFGGWFDHYGLPIVLPAATAAAGFLGAARERRWVVPAILGVAAVVGLATVAINRAQRGNEAQLSAIAAAVGRGPGCLYVYSGSVSLYARTGRCAPTRWLFPSHLGRARESGAIGVDQLAEVRRIFATRPAAVVMRPRYRGERSDVHALAEAEVARGYRLVARLPMGNETVAVYRRGI